MTRCKGSPLTRDFGELSRAAPAKKLRVDPERRFLPRPEGRGLRRRSINQSTEHSISAQRFMLTN
jgi:hypothetical protein